jgi:hypothetical protein
MALLRSIESKIEGIFEGVFGRAFRTNVQPIELARWLAKEMDLHRSVSVSRVYVPNEYTVYLAPSDRAQFSSYEGSLIGELQEYLAEHARREGYALLTPPKVILATDPDLAMGESGVSARVVQPRGGLEPIATPPPPVSAPPAAPSVTMIYPPESDAQPEPTPAPVQERAVLTVEGREVPIAGERIVLGRSRECDVRLTDANVSRRHAEVLLDDDDFWIVDLGSTNGTELNGERIDRAKLSDGDTLTLGSTDVVFHRR